MKWSTDEYQTIIQMTQCSPADQTPHHYKLRDKSNGKFLTKGDLDPSCQEDEESDPAIFTNEELAHDARYNYEREFEQYGKTVEVEVVSFNKDNKLIDVE